MTGFKDLMESIMQVREAQTTLIHLKGGADWEFVPTLVQRRINVVLDRLALALGDRE